MATGRQPTAARRARGFTLLELCVVVSILGLMASLAWPSLRAYSKRIQIRAGTEELVERLAAARERAILSGRPQTVLIPQDGLWSASAASASFFPDGSARFVEMELQDGAGAPARIIVDESGRIEVQGDDAPTPA